MKIAAAVPISQRQPTDSTVYSQGDQERVQQRLADGLVDVDRDL